MSLPEGPHGSQMKEKAMKAICVTADRNLETRDVAGPDAPPPDHLLLQMESSAINHGDITFLARGFATAMGVGGREVWGVSGVGRVIALGEGVPDAYAGKSVAIYRSLHPTPETVGLWSERAIVHHLTCVVLPDAVRPHDYCGSLVNMITPYAFLEQMAEEGHKGVVVTAGGSATGNALEALARRRGIPALHLVRTEAGSNELYEAGVTSALVTTDPNFERDFAAFAGQLGATAVFDGIGGELIGRIAPHLPVNATVYGYGFLGGNTQLGISSRQVMLKNLTIKRFSNFESETVKDRSKLAAALEALAQVIADPLFRTRIGKEFRFEEIDLAMKYEATGGTKAVLVA
jgi:NADPH:quinone reductase